MTANTDRQWFKKNPGRKTRVRLPGPGEIETIMKRSLPALAYEIAVQGGKLRPPPSPDVKWAVLVLNIGPDALLRMVALRPIDWTESTPDADFSSIIMMCGGNLVIDRIGG